MERATLAWGYRGLTEVWKKGLARAQHAAGNLDNRHVEILCAALARVNVSVLYQLVDTANRPWPTSVTPASFPERWPAVPAAGKIRIILFKAIDAR